MKKILLISLLVTLLLPLLIIGYISYQDNFFYPKCIGIFVQKKISYNTYKNDQYGISFEYPAYMQVDEPRYDNKLVLKVYDYNNLICNRAFGEEFTMDFNVYTADSLNAFKKTNNNVDYFLTQILTINQKFGEPERLTLSDNQAYKVNMGMSTNYLRPEQVNNYFVIKDNKMYALRFNQNFYNVRTTPFNSFYATTIRTKFNDQNETVKQHILNSVKIY